MAKLRICLGQIEVVPGQPKENTLKMLQVIRDAKKDNSDLIVFPEMCIPGYLIGDAWERMAFLEECEECSAAIMEASIGVQIAFGNVVMDRSKKNEDGRVRKYNACLVADDGCLAPPIVKTLQPNYREFDDNRHFYDARKMLMDKYLSSGEDDFRDILDEYYEPIDMVMSGSSTDNANLLSIGYMLCEDSWHSDYSFSPVAHLGLKSKMLVNISCSPYTQGKNSKRNRVFGEHARKYKIPLVYVNNVGIQNNGKTVYTFDGGSCIYDKFGNPMNPYPAFEEGWKTFEIDTDAAFGNIDPKENDIPITYKAITYGVKKFTQQMKIERVVIGASGGIDSAVVAAIMADVVGPKNLLLVNMPSKFNSNLTKDAALKLAENLGCNYVVTPIEESVKLTKEQISPANWEIDKWGKHEFYPCGDDILSDFMLENVQARDRSSRVLAAWASWFKGVFTCNANKSEMTVGYTTLYGDLGGFLAPISDLWKGQVYELARYINSLSVKEIIPRTSIDVVPSAELSMDQDVTKGKGDPIIYPYHDKLFAAWVERWDRSTPEDILRWYIEGTLEKVIDYNGSIKQLFNNDNQAFIDDLERWWNLYDGFSVAKRIQAPPVLAVSRRSYGFDHRESQKQPYYSRKYCEMKKMLLEGTV